MYSAHLQENQMLTKQCDRCHHFMHEEQAKLAVEPLEGKTVPVYQCIHCGRIEYETSESSATQTITASIRSCWVKWLNH
jgi:predicted nucleic-acid-binding Zn-ribbon protein